MLSENIDRVALSHSFDEKLFRLLVASISDYAIFMIDPNGAIMSWNQGAQKINGYTEEEIIGQHISVFYTINDNKANVPRENLYAALKNGKYKTEGWKQRKDGSVYWANVAFTTVYNDNGHLVGFAQITRDATIRKEKEELSEEITAELEKRVQENTATIAANEIRFRKLIENSYDGISLFDARLNVVYRSSSAERIIGWNNEERAGQEINDLIHPQDRYKVKELFADIFANPGKPILATYRTRHKLGHYIWIESLFTNRLNDEHIKAIVCNFKDITQRIKAEEELLHKNDQIEDILESITDGFIALDKDFCYLYANKRIGEMLHRDPEELIGKYIWTEFPDAVNSATYKAFNRAATKKQYVVAEDYYAPLLLWQENHIYPAPGGGLSIFIRDISARKKAEKQILHLNETLERKVAERTTQLEAANKELESFSYSVSHDLRAPLRAVNGYAMMLQEDFNGKLGDEGTRLINIITNNARLMGQLIDDLLAFSRMGRKAMVIMPVDMNALVDVALGEALQGQSKEYEIKLHKLPPCSGDLNLLRQVMLNLVSNAVKYSAKTAHPVIEIGCIKNPDQRVYYIKDNGVGFDMKYSAKLFGVFQRLHSAQEFEGTGVGLALAKRIIAKHGGTIWAESAVGQGATFYFSMPVKISKS
ncbi:PAS domain-containing sensor histidine kinase [Mucilaginibacter antarcticus]|uniref:histidine kinase n=1 Tax=Mucilaginibacter antarcticus TaxID=1855725 RepID=A0ABW5XTW4_9SPHI